MYYMPRRFEAHSKLQRYLAYNCPEFVTIKKRDYNLYEILLALKKMIASKKMYDPQNPTVILCDEHLEDALNVKALHVSDVRDYIIRQLPLIEEEEKTENCNCQYHGVPGSYRLPSWGSAAATAVIARESITPNFDLEASYLVKPGLLKVLHAVQGVNPEQRVFRYRELSALLSAYILSKKDVLFDARNIKIAMVENDDLGKAFGVKAFARCQVTSLL